MTDDLTTYLLALGDDALISAQRLGWWISRAPQIEEDIAMANIGLDQLGQARSLLAYAGQVEGTGRSEDDLAYFRDERDFRNVCLVEREQPDFGVAMARMLLFSTWQHELYDALCASTDLTLSGIAAKAVKETAYHLDHAEHWVLRLGDGTPESHRRMQEGLDAEWPWLAELFEGSHISEGLLMQGIAIDPTSLQGAVMRRVEGVIGQATLSLPEVPDALSRGREGRHTEQMGYLLAEMQHLARSHPGVTW